MPAFSPAENSVNGDLLPIARFPEGVLAEIHFWLLNKPQAPLRFFRWADVKIPKYLPEVNWSLVVDEDKKIIGETKNNIPLRFGIIDLGSSTVKLVICSVNPNQEIEVLHKKAFTVNLAEGFFNEKILQPLAMKRTIQAVIDCQNEALSFGVSEIKLFGTGVTREASNFKDFAARIREEAGLELERLSGKDETELIFKAVLAGFLKKDIDLTVVNAGGGSTGIVFGGAEGCQSYSLPIGISDLNERFLGEYPISESQYQSMKTHVLNIIKQIIKKPKKSGIMVYTGGELDYMLITGFPLEDFNLSLAHPKKISLQKFASYAKKMRKMTLAELRSFLPANPNWMNGAIASNTILETMAEYCGAETIIPSNKNLNDGVLLDLIR